ncbi:hypothetical protein pb186bvf_011046 [Paramecium bursaria]
MNRKIKSKKTKTLLKKFDADDDEEHEDVDSQSKEDLVETKKQTMMDIINNVLSKEVKGSAILSEKPQIFKIIKKEKEDIKQKQIKKKIKKTVLHRGHVDPQITNNQLFERELKVIAAKGIVKVFNTLKQHEKQREE